MMVVERELPRKQRALFLVRSFLYHSVVMTGGVAFSPWSLNSTAILENIFLFKYILSNELCNSSCSIERTPPKQGGSEKKEKSEVNPGWHGAMGTPAKGLVKIFTSLPGNRIITSILSMNRCK